MLKLSRLGLSFCALILGSVGTSFAAKAPQADVRIGTVNMQEALRTVADGKNARTTLETAFNQKKAELQKEEESIKKMHEELKKQSLALNQQALAKKQAEIQQRIVQFQEKTAKSQQEIQMKEQELTTPIVEKLKGIISSVAKEKGYTVILEKNENQVLYSQDQDDLTTEVIQLYNKGKS